MYIEDIKESTFPSDSLNNSYNLILEIFEKFL